MELKNNGKAETTQERETVSDEERCAICGGPLEELRVYSCTWRNKWLTASARCIADMICDLQEAVETLRAMREAGVVLLQDGGVEDDYATLVTTDPEVAERFGLEEVDIEEES